jgi:hypothetical protein
VVVDAMLGVGMDLSNAKPQKLIAELAQNAEMLVTIVVVMNALTYWLSSATTGHCQIL